MEPVKSFEEYKGWVQRGKSLEDPVTNCYLMPAAVKEKLHSESLYAMNLENGVLLLDRMEGFYRCYYYLSPHGAYKPLVLDLPGVVEYVFQQELSEAQYRELSLLWQMGFTLGRESGRLSLSADSVKRTCSTDHVSPAFTGDAKEVLALFRSCFDPLYAFLPSKEELAGAIEQGNVLAVYERGRLAAALFAEVARNTASIRHLAVSESFRSRGYGKELVEAYHRRFQGSVKTFSHWVDRGNRPAMELYQRFGYSFDGRRANEYSINTK